MRDTIDGINEQAWERAMIGPVRKSGMRVFALYWSPEGRKIATVTARTMRAAIRKAPKPYRHYLGEIYAVLQ
mgnify:CR=1 FL=1